MERKLPLKIITGGAKGNYSNKTQLVEKIAQNADLSKASAGRALDAFIEAVGDTLQSGDQVALVVLRLVHVLERQRTGRNPKTVKKIAAANVPAFKAGKALKDSCN